MTILMRKTKAGFLKPIDHKNLILFQHLMGKHCYDIGREWMSDFMFLTHAHGWEVKEVGKCDIKKRMKHE